MADLKKIFPSGAMPKTDEAVEAALHERNMDRRFLENSDVVVDLGIGPEDGKRFVYASTDLGVEGKGADIFVIDSDLVAHALSQPNAMSLDSFREFVQDPANRIHKDDFIEALNSAEELTDQQALDIFIQLQIQQAAIATPVLEPDATSMHA